MRALKAVRILARNAACRVFAQLQVLGAHTLVEIRIISLRRRHNVVVVEPLRWHVGDGRWSERGGDVGNGAAMRAARRSPLTFAPDVAPP